MFIRFGDFNGTIGIEVTDAEYSLMNQNHVNQTYNAVNLPTGYIQFGSFEPIAIEPHPNNITAPAVDLVVACGNIAA